MCRSFFSLEAIDIVEHVYLFECEEWWIEALQATFAPYKDKVTIIEKYVSDRNEDLNITIDRFLQDKDIDNLFLKMDIERAEQAALKGADITLDSSKHIDLAICTYHREDVEVISKLLAGKGFNYEFQTDIFFII